MSRLKAFTTVVVCLLSNHAIGQQFFFQPWDGDAISHESRVDKCEDPLPNDWVALDDFRFQANGTLDGVVWWGEVIDLAQVQQPHGYYIAIYADDACQPGALLHEECIKPKVEFAGLDCDDRTVAKFTGGLNGGFQVEAGQRYWLQISEDDERSANVDSEDFRWSGRTPQQGCPAMQMDGNGAVVQPLWDACLNEYVDLSFILRAN